MYEELVKSLNLCAVSTDPIYECCLEDCVAHKGDFDPLCMGTLMLKAAKAIEELSETVNYISHWADKPKPPQEDNDGT